MKLKKALEILRDTFKFIYDIYTMPETLMAMCVLLTVFITQNLFLTVGMFLLWILIIIPIWEFLKK